MSWNEQWIYGALRHIHRNVDMEYFYSPPENDEDWRLDAPDENDAPRIARLPELEAEVEALRVRAEKAEALVIELQRQLSEVQYLL